MAGGYAGCMLVKVHFRKYYQHIYFPENPNLVIF